MSNAIQQKYNVLSGADADGDGEAVTLPIGGLYQYSVNGTFEGTTATLKMLGPDAANYIDIPNTDLSAAGIVNVELPVGATVKCTLSGTTTPAPDVSASLILVR